MTNEFVVLWIDDDEERREEKRGGVGEDEQITVFPYGPLDAASEFLTDSDEEMGLPREPDLALVDWYLHDGDENYAGDGPSIEGILRDRFPNTPIYAFSGKFGDPEFDRDRKRGEHRFAHITAADRLNDSDIINDIRDYRRIREKEGNDVEGLIELLDPPSGLEEKIESTLPQEFAEGLPYEEESDSDSSLRFARWVRNEFLEKPGLLWDAVWTATKVGVDKEAFPEYKPELSRAEYTGIFSHRKERWWKKSIKDEIFERASEEDRDVERTWKDGPELLGVADEDKSTCEVCDKPYPPQTVAAGNSGEKADYQVHYKCSNIEQSRASTYEDLRVLVPL